MPISHLSSIAAPTKIKARARRPVLQTSGAYSERCRFSLIPRFTRNAIVLSRLAVSKARHIRARFDKSPLGSNHSTTKQFVAREEIALSILAVSKARVASARTAEVHTCCARRRDIEV